MINLWFYKSTYLYIHKRERERQWERDIYTERERQTENMQCAIASACKHYRYCDQTYAAKHFSSGNALSIYYKAANHFIIWNVLSLKLPVNSLIELSSALTQPKIFITDP